MENRAEGDVDKIVQRRFFSTDGRPESGPLAQARVFVEVGAARPDFLSVSALYRKLGWKVLAIEPNPAYAALHEAKGYEILPYACGDHDEDDVEFSVVNSHGAEYEGGEVSFESFSSLGIKDNYATLKLDLDVTKINVRLRRLDTILADHAADVSEVDIVCVDVEGWELEVLKGLDFGRYRPRVLIIENMFFEEEYRRFMAERGYGLWKTINFNEVYARRDIMTSTEVLTGKLDSKARGFFRALHRNRKRR